MEENIFIQSFEALCFHTSPLKKASQSQVKSQKHLYFVSLLLSNSRSEFIQTI